MRRHLFVPGILSFALCNLFLTTGCRDYPVDAEPCRSVVMMAGVDDHFAQGNSEQASPAPELLSYMMQTYYGPYLLHQFDQTEVDRPVGHTFQIPGVDAAHPVVVKRAILTLRVKALRSALDNDWFHLMVNDGNGGILGVFDASFVYLNGGSWRSGNEMVLTFDLGNMPAGQNPPTDQKSILDDLGNGVLHVYLQDDTAVDFMKLDVDYCTVCLHHDDPSRDV